MNGPDNSLLGSHFNAHLAHWPPGRAQALEPCERSVWRNLEQSARARPDADALVFYGTRLSYAQLYQEVEQLAGWLQREAGVQRGDRVLLDMQNSPNWVVAYYAILRADACVVPCSPMLLTQELRYLAQDSGAHVALVAQELLPAIAPLLADGALSCAVAANYSYYLRQPTDLAAPEFVAAPARPTGLPNVLSWAEVLQADLQASPSVAGPDDLCVICYTSGTTGQPKGCVHTHRSVMHTLRVGCHWFDLPPNTSMLATLPFFHVTGMQGSMNAPIYCGGSAVILPRWERDVAARLIQRYRVVGWQAVPTMVIDFMSNPRLDDYDLSSIRTLSGGGAAMPAPVAARMREKFGCDYVEGYGLSETMAPSHINPPQRPKPQCLGIPVFDTEALVVDSTSMQPLPPGEIGEILIRGPQVFQGYWNRPDATAASFVEIAGRRWFRSGDLGYVDPEGYFFMVDRLKRMINASGLKVWPAEVETMMYAHPAIQECCVIAARDTHRGETVKAVVVLREGQRNRVSAEEIVEWARGQMAAYKVPRLIEFAEALPRSATGKVLWRALQEKELQRG